MSLAEHSEGQPQSPSHIRDSELGAEPIELSDYWRRIQAEDLTLSMRIQLAANRAGQSPTQRMAAKVAILEVLRHQQLAIDYQDFWHAIIDIDDPEYATSEQLELFNAAT